MTQPELMPECYRSAQVTLNEKHYHWRLSAHEVSKAIRQPDAKASMNSPASYDWTKQGNARPDAKGKTNRQGSYETLLAVHRITIIREGSIRTGHND